VVASLSLQSTRGAAASAASTSGRPWTPIRAYTPGRWHAAAATAASRQRGGRGMSAVQAVAEAATANGTSGEPA
jgi:hypothetical protein